MAGSDERAETTGGEADSMCTERPRGEPLDIVSFSIGALAAFGGDGGWGLTTLLRFSGLGFGAGGVRPSRRGKVGINNFSRERAGGSVDEAVFGAILACATRCAARITYGC